MSRSIFDDRTTGEKIADFFKMGSVVIGALLFFTFLILMGAFLGAWGEMLMVGILHGEYWHHLPTMGFGTAFKLNLVVLFFMALIRGLATVLVSWFQDIIK